MQPKRNIDWQIRKLLRKHPVPSHQLREELWRGIESALDEQQPVRKTRRGLIGGIAALLLVASGTAAYFFTNSQEPIAQVNNTVPEQTYASARQDRNATAGYGKDITLNAEGKELTAENSNVMPGRSAATILTGEYLAEIQSAALVHSFKKEVVTQTLADVKNTMAAFAVRQQERGLASATTPLSAKPLKYAKRKKNTAIQDGSSWTSLFLNIWDNPAYTGASGKLALSYDDHMSFFDYWQSGIYRDYFAVDGRIPKTPFSVGVYHDRGINAYSRKTATALTASARVLNIGRGYLTLGGGISHLSKRYFRTENVHHSDKADITFGLAEVMKKRTFTTLNTAISLEAGAWYQSKNLIAGVSVKNANQPLFGYTEQGERLDRSWHFTGGYRIGLGKFQVLPVLQVERNKLYSQANASILATFDDKISLGGAIQNISPVSPKGDKVAYAGAKVFDNVTIFTSYGRNGEMAAKGINRHIIHTGIRFQLP